MPCKPAGVTLCSQNGPGYLLLLPGADALWSHFCDCEVFFHAVMKVT